MSAMSGIGRRKVGMEVNLANMWYRRNSLRNLSLSGLGIVEIECIESGLDSCTLQLHQP